MHWVLNKYLFHMFSVFLPRKKAFRMRSDTFFHPYTILSESNSTNALYCRKIIICKYPTKKVQLQAKVKK